MALQDYLPASLQPQRNFFPMSGTDMANGVFTEAAVQDYQRQQATEQQEQAKRQAARDAASTSPLIRMAREAAIQDNPTLNYVQRQIAANLLGAKKAWLSA